MSASPDRLRPGSTWQAPPTTPAEERVIVALLEHPRHEDAAKAAKVSVRTLRRYITREHVRASLAQAATHRLRMVTTVLARHAERAAEDLGRMATGDLTPNAARVRACIAVVELGSKAIEIESFARRLEELERGAQALTTPGRGGYS